MLLNETNERRRRSICKLIRENLDRKFQPSYLVFGKNFGCYTINNSLTYFIKKKRYYHKQLNVVQLYIFYGLGSFESIQNKNNDVYQRKRQTIKRE